jgi:hypothetical protein
MKFQLFAILLVLMEETKAYITGMAKHSTSHIETIIMAS